MLLNTTNVRRAGETTRARGGSLMAYAAAGFARRLDGLDDAAVRDAFSPTSTTSCLGRAGSWTRS